ncbi:uncharacterized protein LOC125946433 [Dermacentor silvarum]|uniref:uncharacterized protein LOC125946433 n=1 Tax=Dermacentor silvarum TaxID=543639 RepID=UPI002100FC52|nr:uncharacterized protein LOC125946433 [Dermacentor silvarum]
MDAPMESVVASADNDHASAAITENLSHRPHRLYVFAMAIVMGLIAVQIVCWMLEKLGFGKQGIKANSVAANWQASMQGVVPSQSLFARLQRCGVRGLPGYAKFFIGYYTFFFFFISSV